jgi:transposase InsO family protein
VKIVTNTTSRLRRVARNPAPSLSPRAKQRLLWFDVYARNGRNAVATCRLLGISRSTFYTWKRRYDPKHLSSLEDRSRRPHTVRSRHWTTREVTAVRDLRRKYPRWGKLKLQTLLAHNGLVLSVSKVGRILAYLRASGQLVDPPAVLRRQQRSWSRNYARRKPRDYTAEAPGDLLQLDTVDYRPVPSTVLKQFTFIDVHSRYLATFGASNATAHSARRALISALERFPFHVRAIQVDGGSEFMSVFEDACRELGLDLFVLPPRSPKLNGRVERANRTTREECHDCSTSPPTVAGLVHDLARYDRVYNRIRPHQALGLITPRRAVLEFFAANPNHPNR